jgi:phosphatidate phosphatase APP1
MRPPHQAAGSAASVKHIAARLEDRLHAFRERNARRRGYQPAMIPYAGYGSSGWVRVLGRTMLANPNGSSRHPGGHDAGNPRSGTGTEPPAQAAKPQHVPSIRGWRSFTSVPMANARVTIEIASVRHEVVADRGGVVDVVVPVELAPGEHTVRLSVEDCAPAEATVYVSPPDVKLGILSDIDDTVMVTALPRPLLAFWNTFVLNEHARSPTPGMAVLMERLTARHSDAPVIYLSTGAWNVAPTLSRFLTRNLYPAGALLLTDWGPTMDRWFRSGVEHKRGNLRRLAQQFPDTRWILIGDDGQHDPQIYADFAAGHPENVAAIAIRQLSISEAVLAGGRAVGQSRHLHGVPWVQSPDGAGLAQQLQQLGLL